MEVSLRVGCLPYAVGKQPSIPLINLGRNGLMMMMIFLLFCNVPSRIVGIRKVTLLIIFRMNISSLPFPLSSNELYLIFVSTLWDKP